MSTEQYATSAYDVTHSQFDSGVHAAYSTSYVYYPATGEEIIVRPLEPTTEVGRELAQMLSGEVV